MKRKSIGERIRKLLASIAPRRRRRKSRNAIYDEQTLEVMRRVLSPTSPALDVGAHRGTILRHIVALAPRATHHAVEPLPHLAEALRAAHPEVVVHACAVSEEGVGEAAFHYVVNDPAYSGLRERTYDRPDPQIQKIRVRLSRLDDLVPEPTRIAFLKLDVEGGEYGALRGAPRILSRDRPVVVFEAGVKSSGHYGVDADDFFDLFEGHRMHVSTMQRWLRGEAPFTREVFRESWARDYCFLASPAESSTTSTRSRPASLAR